MIDLLNNPLDVGIMLAMGVLGAIGNVLAVMTAALWLLPAVAAWRRRARGAP